MKILVLLFSVCLAKAADVPVPLSWDIDETAEGIRLDVHSGTNLVSSHIYVPAVTNATLSLGEGDFLITAVALGNMNWVTNVQTGAVWSTNAVVSSAPSNAARVRVLPKPSVKLYIQSADSVDGKWVDAASFTYEIQEIDNKFFRAVMRQTPLPPIPNE